MESIEGRIAVRLDDTGSPCEHRLYISISGLPSWLMQMLRDSSPLIRAGSTYYASGNPGVGPSSLQFMSSLVYSATEARPKTIEKATQEPSEDK